MWAVCLLLLALAVVSVDAKSLRGHRENAWPPPNQIYNDPSKPPLWMQPPSLDKVALAVPRTPPAPVAPSALLPADPYIINAAYFDEMSRQYSTAGGTGKTSTNSKNTPVWPPSPPTGPPGAFMGPMGAWQPPFRPLTLLDAKGGEYAKNDPTIGGKKK
jgi:hypothetical protein